MHGEIIEKIDCKPFGNVITKNTSSSLTRVAFQNVGLQLETKFNNKSRQGAASFSQGKYDVLLFTEHGLNHSKIPQSQKLNKRMNHYSKGSFSIVGFNRTTNCDNWNLPGGTGITITKTLLQGKTNQEAAAKKLDSEGGLG